MRWHLLKTYDKIYIIDLHGNSKKKETTPDGSIDQNVFDIMQGVSINLFIKTGKEKAGELGKVFHYDLYGNRELKYDFLLKNSISTINYKELPNKAPNYFMVQKDFEIEEKYNKGFSLKELFPINGVGLTTAHDNFVIKDTQKELLEFYKKFQSSPRNAELLHKEFDVRKKQGWDILQGYDSIQGEKKLSKYIKVISYRPFESKFIFYENKLVWRTVIKVMQHFLEGENVALSLCKQFKASDTYQHIFVTDKIIESSYVSNKTSEITSVFPLYLYPEISEQQSIDESTLRKPNLNQEIVDEIAKKIGLTFTNEKEELPTTFAPIDILDYIYAVLHSPTYREKYKEFLKIDFPRVLYPKDKKIFWKLVKLGGKIRQIHLLKSPTVEERIIDYPKDGNNTITTKIVSKDWELLDGKKQIGRIWINETQYFNKIPLVAWEFYIGGYQPAQKWLKDRKGRILSSTDILHYQKIIIALFETDRLMKEIDAVGIE